MKANLVSETKTYLLCPECGKGKFQISHLFGTNYTFGPWACNKCGTSVRGKVKEAFDVDIEIDYTTHKRKQRRTTEVLMLPLSDKPTLLAVKAFDYGHNDEDKIHGNNQYFYESHTCPTNWISSVKMAYQNGDDDPHGAFKYLGTQIVPHEFDYRNDELMRTFIVEKMIENGLEITQRDLYALNAEKIDNYDLLEKRSSAYQEMLDKYDINQSYDFYMYECDFSPIDVDGVVMDQERRTYRLVAAKKNKENDTYSCKLSSRYYLDDNKKVEGRWSF